MKVERKKDEYMLRVFSWSLGSLTLFSYLVPMMLSEMGINILISYTELMTERLSELVEVTP